MVLFSLFVFFASLQSASSYRIVCYYSNWAQYRTGRANFVAENISASLCTHIVYGYAEPAGIAIKAVEWNDNHAKNKLHTMYQRVLNMKKDNPTMKVLLALADNSNGYFSYMTLVSTAPARMSFAQEIVKFLRLNNLDGIDVNLNYPHTRGMPVIDRYNYVQLIQQVSEVFWDEYLVTKKPRLIISATVGHMKETIDKFYDAVNIAKYTEFISILSFDLHGSWEHKVGINAPLYSHDMDTDDDAYLNMDWVVQYYLSMPIDRKKVNIGLAFYGRSFTLSNPEQHAVGSSAKDPGKEGKFTRKKGCLSYYEVCDMIRKGGTVVNVPEQHGRYVVLDDQWVGYDDIQSITEKACYVRNYNIGGVIVRSLDLDDFNGLSCSQGVYPLLTAVNNVLRAGGEKKCSVFSPQRSSGANQIITESTGSMMLCLSLLILWTQADFYL